MCERVKGGGETPPTRKMYASCTEKKVRGVLLAGSTNQFIEEVGNSLEPNISGKKRGGKVQALR